jgi:phytoene synthase
MKALFDQVSHLSSKLTTKKYSTSFSLGILCLDKSIHQDIYNIYGLVRFADEIVDTFHGFDKRTLLTEFKDETFKAIERKISLNPILNSFQETVNKYDIDHEHILTFFKSMEMDLEDIKYDHYAYEQYILGSAEVVGLMCLKVFTQGDLQEYESLKPFAMKLGAAFQKVNFLRDIKSDYETLGRIYFPNINVNGGYANYKAQIEEDIEQDFKISLEGIKTLPKNSRFGVYVAYMYYQSLFMIIKQMNFNTMFYKRIRVNNFKKFYLIIYAYFRFKLRLI